MVKRKHTPEQVLNKLRQAEIAISKGSTVAEASRKIGVSRQTLYRWRSEYAGGKITPARNLKQLETENARLQRALERLSWHSDALQQLAKSKLVRPFPSPQLRRACQSGFRSLRAACLQGARTTPLHAAPPADERVEGEWPLTAGDNYPDSGSQLNGPICVVDIT